ncbi:MAG: PA domain-containing protein, partial [Limisphaerales bacterium]
MKNKHLTTSPSLYGVILASVLALTTFCQGAALLTLDKLNGYVGVLGGAATFTSSDRSHTGKPGDYAMDFTTAGTGNVTITNATFLNQASSNDVMTFSVWVYRYDINSSSCFWALSPSSNNGQRGFQAHTPWSDDNIYFDTAGCCDGSLQRINASISTFPGYSGNDTWWNQWHHLVFIKNLADKQIWIDGQLFLEGNNTSPLPTDFTSLALGNDGQGANFMHGMVDDFAVYSTALSSASIGLLFSGTSPTNLPGEKILAYWDFNDPPVIGAPIGSPVGFTIPANDVGTSVLDTNTISLALNGTTVTPSSVTLSGSTVLINYLLPNPPFPSGSTQTTSLTIKDKGGNTFSGNGTFIVSPFGTIPASFSAPAGGVDTTKGGFNVKTFVADLPYGLENTTYRAEAQVDGILGNFLFATNIPNVAVPGPNADGSYTETQWINYNITHDGTGEAGDFRAPNFPDSGFPGMPGNAVVESDPNANSAAEVTAFLDLKAGLNRMIVNSDDGFRVTAGPNYRDALSVKVGEFSGGRGASDTSFDFFVQSDGIYPFRLIWENGGGGANLEWIFVDLATGKKVLINNLTNVGAVVKAYYSGGGRAWISSISPYVNGVDIAPSAPIQLTITDGKTTVASTAVKLNLDGTDVTATSTKSGNVTTVKYTPPTPLAMGPHTATVTYTESDGTVRTGPWKFSTQGPLTSGFVRQDIYRDGGGDEHAVITRTDPAETHYLTSWATPDDEQGDNYTERLFAWFTPDETTDYVFFISSDDHSELYISPDRNPVNYALLAREPQWNNSRNWVNTDRRDGTNPENRTDLNNLSPGPLHLTKGQHYFLITPHQEGGGGDHVDLLVMKAADVTAPAGGGSGEPVNGEPASGGSRFGLYELFPPVIVSETPAPGGNSSLQPNLHIVLTSGSFPMDNSSIQLFLNGADVTAASTITATTNPPGADVFYSYPILPPGTNTVKLIVADKASPPNVRTEQYTFITQPLNSLDIGLGTLPGSGDATKPGFRYKIVQTADARDNSNLQLEVELAGGYGANIADETGVGTDGYFILTNVINLDIADSSGNPQVNGDFNAPDHPDILFPGLPGTTGSTDNPAAEFLTYVEFPTAGYYAMGVNSDDGFRVSSATNQDYPVNLVTIKSPANLAQNLVGIESGFAPALPQLADVGPITGNVVAMDPPDDSAAVNNAAALKGNIALIDRGAVTFAQMVKDSQAAGAIGVIVADQQTDPQRIIVMGGGAGPGISLPAVMINYASGQILHTALAGGTT